MFLIAYGGIVLCVNGNKISNVICIVISAVVNRVALSTYTVCCTLMYVFGRGCYDACCDKHTLYMLLSTV